MRLHIIYYVSYKNDLTVKHVLTFKDMIARMMEISHQHTTLHYSKRKNSIKYTAE